MAEKLKMEEGKEGKKRKGKEEKRDGKREGRKAEGRERIIPNSSFYKELTLKTTFNLQLLNLYMIIDS